MIIKVRNWLFSVIALVLLGCGGGGGGSSTSPSTSVAGYPQANSGSPLAIVDPTSLNFGEQGVGAAAQPKTVSLINNGTGELVATKFTIRGVNASEFSQTNTCSSKLRKEENCSITITFLPTSSGAKAAELLVETNGGTKVVLLFGAGAASVASLSPTGLIFGSQVLGAASSSRSVSLTNTGKSVLSISSIAVTGDHAEDFVVASNCPGVLQPSGQCSINLSFRPLALGGSTAVLEVVGTARLASIVVDGIGVGELRQVGLDAQIGLEPQLGASIPRLRSFGNGWTLVAYRRGIDRCASTFDVANCTESSEIWSAIVDQVGLVAQPRQVSASLDADRRFNNGSRFPTSISSIPNGVELALAVGHSGHNNFGGNIHIISLSNLFQANYGMEGSYQSQVCTAGSDLVVSSLYVDPVTNRAHYFTNIANWRVPGGTLMFGPINFGGRGFNYPARQDLACGSAARFGKYAVIGDGGPGVNWRLRHYRIDAPLAWTLVGSASVIPTSANPTLSTWPMGIALADGMGVSLFQDVDVNGRAQIYFVRFRLDPFTGLTLIDTVGQPLVSNEFSYEGLSAAIVYGGSEDEFYIAMHSATPNPPQRGGGVQTVTLHRLSFNTGQVIPVSGHIARGWLASNNLQDNLVSSRGHHFYGDVGLSLSCDGGLYLGVSNREGSERGRLRVFRHALRGWSCSGSPPCQEGDKCWTPPTCGIPNPRPCGD